MGSNKGGKLVEATTLITSEISMDSFRKLVKTDTAQADGQNVKAETPPQMGLHAGRPDPDSPLAAGRLTRLPQYDEANKADAKPAPKPAAATAPTSKPATPPVTPAARASAPASTPATPPKR